MHNWLLPEFLEDILPQQALRMELLRRKLLDLFHTHGYQLVFPPLLEYLESLLTGTGHDLDLKTFKLVDQMSGRLMGLRADITPQMARIDAHLLNRAGVVRLCYAGSVVHTLPFGLAKTREPIQLGAELFGHAGPEADLEIQQLMLEALRLAGVADMHLDLGHVGIFGGITDALSLTPELEAELFVALQTKDTPLLQELTRDFAPEPRAAIRLLPELYGGRETLVEARRQLPAYAGLTQALDELEWIAARLDGQVKNLCFDLAELRGYHYHSGMVFSAYANGMAEAIARGGRYDAVGLAFGRSRPATGFSMELRGLSEFFPEPPNINVIVAPLHGEPGLQEKIDSLRAQGEIVIRDLPGQKLEEGEKLTQRKLVWRDKHWVVVDSQKSNSNSH